MDDFKGKGLKKTNQPLKLSPVNAERIKRAQEHHGPHKVLIESPGNTKMSQVLIDFARPLLALDPAGEFFEEAIAAAVIAWNIALSLEHMPETTIEEHFENAVDMKPDDPDAEALFEQIVMLVRRKKKYFSKQRRLILDFIITESEDMFHLDVITELQ